jgi:hypothetical protein
LKRPEIDRRLAAGEPTAQVARDYDGGNRAVSLDSSCKCSVHMDDAFARMEQKELCDSSHNFAILTAIRRASSLLSNFAAAC